MLLHSKYVMDLIRDKSQRPSFIFGKSNSGNLLFNINFDDLTYQIGELNIADGGAIIIGKFCTGKVVIGK